VTIEKLLDCSADKLASFTHEQLEEFFRPFFPTTRPELATRQKKESPTHSQPTLRNIPTDPAKRAAKLQAMEIAAKFGVKLKL